MVQRKKRVKSSGAGGNKPERAVALESYSGTRSPLVALPAEIQDIITSNLVQLRDLNHLCCTCKTLNSVVLPTLYHTIELKVSLQWNQLPSLEKLLVSSSAGFKYTRCLRLVTRQYGQDDDTYVNIDKVPETDREEINENGYESGGESEARSDDAEEEAEGIFRLCQPHRSASNSLNALIRVLIVKLPPQQLHTFWWEHACSLSTLTLSIVLKHHGASIHTLHFRQHTRNWRNADLEDLTIAGLTSLSIAGLRTDASWAMNLLAKNYHNLRHLQLGSDLDLAVDYANNGHVDPEEHGRYNISDQIEEIMRPLAASNQPSTLVARLESLSLIGLNFDAIANGYTNPAIDFNNLSVLILESCVGLEEGFLGLMGAGSGRRKAKCSLRLHTLAIRHENTRLEVLQGLEKILHSLKPLAHLRVLLEGDYEETLDMRKILRVHGKSLQSLIWDERTGPRCQMHKETAIITEDHANLELVARHCPGLKALGISLDWADVTESEEHHTKIASSFSQLSQLQTLNIRNLPVASKSTTWLPIEYMVEGLVTMLLNIIIKNAHIRRALVLKTVAIGASTYAGVRLRIYHVVYDYQYRNIWTPKLHLIARGVPTGARGNADHLDIFAQYWLDGVLLDPKRHY